MRRSKTAALLLAATLAISTLTATASATPDKIVDASGGADEVSAVLQQAEEALAGDPVEIDAGSELSPEPEASGTVIESPTIALADLAVAYPELTAQEQRRADEILARPDAGGGIDLKDWTAPPADRRVVCATHVCVHYVVSSTDTATQSWAETTLAVMESVWNFEIATMGYRAPAPDGARGTDTNRPETVGKFDVYLSNIGGDGYYGYCAGEAKVPGQSLRESGYCVLDNDFTEFVLNPTSSLKVTAAHEFFHAIQFNYDALEDRWLMEATATWMEERYADSINDNRQFLRFGQSSKPGVPLDTFGGLTHYGNWLFFERLSRKYGTDSVRSIWNRLDATRGKTDQYSVQAIKNFLQAEGTTLPKFYVHFAAGNLSPAKHYSEGSVYRPARFADTFTLKSGRKSINARQAKLRHLTSKSYRFKAAKSLRGNGKLRITVDGPEAKTGPAALAYVYLKNGKITKKFIKLNKAGFGSTRVKFSRSKVTRVTLTLVNASPRYVCWRQGTYACQGFAKDDGSKFTFSAKVLS